MKFLKLPLTLVAISAAFAGFIAQAGPQDNWYFETFWGGQGIADGQFGATSQGSGQGAYGVAIGTDQKVYVTDIVASNVQVFEQNGQFIRKWSTGYGPRGIAQGPDGNFYVGIDGGIQVFTPTGTLVRSWGSVGTGDGQFGGGSSWGVTVSPEGKVFTTDGGNARVQVFQSNGTFITKWGSPGSLQGQFSSIRSIALNADGNVYVSDGGRIQIFDQNGTFIRLINVGTSALAIGADGTIYSATSGSITVCTQSGQILQNWGSFNNPNGLDFPSASRSMAVTKEGRIFIADSGKNRVWVYGRSFRSGPTSNQLPQPGVLQILQRPSSTVMDIDYRVIDTDTPTVEVRALAFADGVKSLANLIPINTLVEGTDVKLGLAIPSNTTHRLSWNAAADWNVSLGTVSVAILANDGRNLLPFDYITIPAGGGNPALKISRTPYDDTDFLSAWLWLISKKDPAVSMVGGVVKAVGGSYNGQDLTSGDSTTATGRAFLFARLNVREATAAEVLRARADGSPTWFPQYSVGPGKYPVQVNAFGFEVYVNGAPVSVVALD